MCYENVCATGDILSWILSIGTSCKVVTFMSCFLSPWVKTSDACYMGVGVVSRTCLVMMAITTMGIQH